MTGSFDDLVVNYFNGIPNTTRVYQSTPFKVNRSTILNTLQPDLYGSLKDRSAILDLADESVRKNGIYAECMIPSSDAMNFVKSIQSVDLPWIGAFFGLSINATWYWCTDQVSFKSY